MMLQVDPSLRGSSSVHRNVHQIYIVIIVSSFGDTGRRAIYFQGFGEKGHLFSGIWGESITFWVLGSREQGVEEKHFRKLGKKVIFLSGSREQRPSPPAGGGGGGSLSTIFCNKNPFCNKNIKHCSCKR